MNMKYCFALVYSLFLSPSLQAEQRLGAGFFADEALTVSAVPGKPLQPLFEITDPGISSPVYALKGMIRYKDVQGDGFLQLDNHFAETGAFFTKSLATAGPLAKISGSSDWRAFTLPFYASGGEQADAAPPLPNKLSLALYLPGSGTVSLRGVALYQYANGEDPLQVSGQWFDAGRGGLLGAIGGGLLGLWGALIGALAGRGKARRFVLGSANTLLVIGIASSVGGVAALASDQAYAVYFPLLLIGIIVVAVIGALRGSLSARYEQFELQTMQSMDV